MAPPLPATSADVWVRALTSADVPWEGSGLEHDLHALVLLVLEGLVAARAPARADSRCVITKLGSISPSLDALAAAAACSAGRGTGRS